MKRGPWMIVGQHLRTGKHIDQYKSQGGCSSLPGAAGKRVKVGAFSRSAPTY